jgi:shikimate dehydrogenase
LPVSAALFIVAACGRFPIAQDSKPIRSMNISGTTRVFLILGDPVAQVRAPEIYNHLFRRHGVDAVLVPAQVAPADFDAFARSVLSAANIDGLWLTIPHKTSLVEQLDRCDRLGRAAGAVNAVRRNADGSLEGALFDGTGFVKSLDHFGIAIDGRRALVVGVGGAGLAIAASLADRGAAQIALYDRQGERAAQAAAQLRRVFANAIVVATSADPAGYDLIVNATPLGLQAGDALPFDASRVDRDAAVVDILMKNQPTPLLRACHARNVIAQPGFEMLVQQIPEYLSFFGYDSIAHAVSDDPTELRGLLVPQ